VFTGRSPKRGALQHQVAWMWRSGPATRAVVDLPPAIARGMVFWHTPGKAVLTREHLPPRLIALALSQQSRDPLLAPLYKVRNPLLVPLCKVLFANPADLDPGGLWLETGGEPGGDFGRPKWRSCFWLRTRTAARRADGWQGFAAAAATDRTQHFGGPG
jgi:hypothetical protein